ncbi:MAG: hypothetical protein PHG79_04615, partial [Methanosarcina sp.]|nr:hypothetical protein [Methanosarcina sp.]
MKPLEKTLRNKLEKTVKEARDTAEAATRTSLEQLGVGEASPFSHLLDEQKDTRRKLRAHGRQLGDQRNTETGTQEIDLLVEEVAYEHWHRMLFARFLAENNLLMYPDDLVAVTLEECEELAADEGAKNGWELASRYAAYMLPQIFRPNSPVFQLALPPEHQQKLEKLLNGLPSEVFTASDSLGWVYQFWQAKKKDEVNASGVKIGARELPIVTQLFTEPYMVSFLLDNSLGAWWAAHRLIEKDLKTATNEEELRHKVSLPSVPLEYLRFVRTEEGTWSPAAGTFDGWPEHLSELKTLDPCCGSGHFLVAAFLMLVPMRMELEGLSAKDAVDAVLHDNLHGLEIDQRCVELAAFALALTAWRYPDAGGYRILPDLHIACSGLSISTKKEDWMALAGDNNNLWMSLEELYNQFKNASFLGSLIDPDAVLFKGTFIEMKWEEVTPLLTRALSGEKDDEKTEMGVVAQGIVKTASLLSRKYHWIITNPPYLGERKQSEQILSHSRKCYSEGRADLATTFLLRGERFVSNMSQCLVLPQNWLYQRSYKSLRVTLLRKKRIRLINQLGANSFDSPIGADVLLLILSNGNESFYGIDLTGYSDPYEKAELSKSSNIKSLNSKILADHGDSRITIESRSLSIPLMEEYGSCYAGILNGDTPRFIAKMWEIPELGDKWSFIQSTVTEIIEYGGKSNIVLWENGNGQLRSLAIELKERLHDADRRGNKAWGKYGIAISQMGSLPTTIYDGSLFDSNVAVISPFDKKYLLAMWTYCSSPDFYSEVRKIDKKKNVTNATLVKVPFDIDYWTKVAAEIYPNGLPKPYSEDPTQWIFHGHPAKSDSPLHVAIVRLLGYRWPAELDEEMELSDEARALVKKCDDLLSSVDEDGIVCIPPVRGETSAADQLLNLLAAAYGDSWNNDKLSELLKQADHAGKPLETWLREKFFTQHCKIFQHRPFIWHIWDGLRDGFAALVNYHKLDKKLLETLIYTYLGDWISRQKQDKANGVDGSQEKLDAAESLKKKLELILEGEAPYDIFVRWKPIEKQPVGWDPDLNDGVRLNIRPFMSVPDVSKKGAGVLRDKPNINWNKDRGTDVG